MAQNVIYNCDECGVQKMESNHWIIIFNGNLPMTVSPWHVVAARNPQTIHLCGAGCAAKVLSKQIHEWSLKPVVDLVP